MSTDFDSIKFDFQDCDSFLASLDNEEDPPNSAVYPSQDYINNGGIYDKQQQQFKSTGNQAWNGDRSFAFNTAARDPYAVNGIAANRDVIDTDGNSFDFRDSSSNSSPLSGAVSVSSASDFDTVSSGQYGGTMPGMGTLPITPPDIPNGQKLTPTTRNSVGNIPLKTEQLYSSSLKSDVSKKDTPSSTSSTKTGRVTKRRKEKTSHNMIEKKYRTNINDKILALRDCVPALRCVVSGNRRENLDGLTPASKLNKATVLTKATEYIMHLQSRNNVLQQEVEMLKARIGNAAGPAYKPEMNMALESTNIAPNGYQGQNFDAYPQQNSNGGVIPKVMMCSMAGLMGSNMMVENNNNGSRGLSSFPVFAMFSNMKLGPIDFTRFMFGLKLILIIGAVVYAVSPGFFSRPRRAKFVQNPLLNSLHLRKQTWMITSQYLRVPKPRDVIDSAVTLMTISIEVIICSILGLGKYKTLKNMFSGKYSFEDTEEALIRASDCQLYGGDEQCTDSRILATFLQGFLTKPSPMRFMIQALQLKVLSAGGFVPKKLASRFAQYLWNQARQANEKHLDDLPSHIRALLDQPDVLDDSESIQRLRNLALGLPATYGCKFNEPFITSASDDCGIYSSCDALACWYSISLTQKTLVKSINGFEDESISRSLNLATKTCPRNTDAFEYVLTARALLLGNDKMQYIRDAQKCISESIEHYRMEKSLMLQEEHETGSTLSDENSSDEEDTEGEPEPEMEISSHSSSSVAKSSATPVDIKLGIMASFVLHFINHGQVDEAFDILKKVKLQLNAPIGLLSFVSLYNILNKVKGQVPTEIYKDLEPFAAICRLWIGSEDASNVGIEIERRRELVGHLVKLSVLYSGLDLDEGYSSSN